MRYRILLVALFAVVVLPPAQSSEPDDGSLVLPGTFSEQTTVDDLQTRFGKANVRIVEAVDNDGVRGVVLFADDPRRRAYVAFHDAAVLKGVQSIAVRDAGSRWRGKGGVHVGMSFAALRELNGKPFYFNGFDQARRGTANDQWSPSLDADDGKLGRLDVGEGDQMYFGVELGLRSGGEGIPEDVYPHDETIGSDDPRYPRLGELVEVTGMEATTSLDDEW